MHNDNNMWQNYHQSVAKLPTTWGKPTCGKITINVWQNYHLDFTPPPHLLQKYFVLPGLGEGV